MRTVLSCSLLVVVAGAGATGRNGGGTLLSARPCDAAGQITFNGPGDDRKAPLDRPLEVTSKDGGGRMHRRHGRRRGRPLPGRRTRRGRQPLALHGPCWPQRPATPSGSPRRTATAPRRPCADVRDRGGPAADEGRVRARTGHLRGRAAPHGRTQPPRHDQGGPRRRRAGASRSRLHRPPSPARGTGSTTSSSTTGPRSTGRPAPDQPHQQPRGRPRRQGRLRHPHRPARPHHRGPRRGRHRRRRPPDGVQAEQGR